MYTSSINAEDKIGAYGEYKRRAEDLVLAANWEKSPSGQVLSSCSLRPVAMYGEGDIGLVLNGMKQNINRNTFTRLGDDAPRFQSAYAGNIAWSFVSAIHRMRETVDNYEQSPNPRGRAICVADDTPLKSYSRFIEPYILHVGAKLSAFYVPFWMLSMIASVCEWISYLSKPIYPIRLPLSKMAVLSMYSLSTVHADEAKSYIGYSPLYSHETSLSRSLRYYRYAYELKPNKITEDF